MAAAFQNRAEEWRACLCRVQEAGCAALANLAAEEEGSMQSPRAGAGAGGARGGSARANAARAEAVRAVVGAMGSSLAEAGVQEAGCRALANMALTQEAQAAVAEAGGLDAAVAAMRVHCVSSADVCCAAAAALAHLCWARTALRRAAREAGAAELLRVCAAQFPNHPPLHEATQLALQKIDLPPGAAGTAQQHAFDAPALGGSVGQPSAFSPGPSAPASGGAPFGAAELTQGWAGGGAGGFAGSDAGGALLTSYGAGSLPFGDVLVHIPPTSPLLLASPAPAEAEAHSGGAGRRGSGGGGGGGASVEAAKHAVGAAAPAAPVAALFSELLAETPLAGSLDLTESAHSVHSQGYASAEDSAGEEGGLASLQEDDGHQQAAAVAAAAVRAAAAAVAAAEAVTSAMAGAARAAALAADAPQQAESTGEAALRAPAGGRMEPAAAQEGRASRLVSAFKEQFEAAAKAKAVADSAVKLRQPSAKHMGGVPPVRQRSTNPFDESDGEGEAAGGAGEAVAAPPSAARPPPSLSTWS